MYNEKKERIESCVLIADIDDSSYHFHVHTNKIEEAMKVIELTCKRLNKNLNRLYIGGFVLESESSVLTKERLIELISFINNGRVERVKYTR